MSWTFCKLPATLPLDSMVPIPHAMQMAIERKKEEAERALFEAEQMEAQRKAQAQRAHELAEDRRRKEEAARRETVGHKGESGPAAMSGCMEKTRGCREQGKAARRRFPMGLRTRKDSPP